MKKVILITVTIFILTITWFMFSRELKEFFGVSKYIGNGIEGLVILTLFIIFVIFLFITKKVKLAFFTMLLSPFIVAPASSFIGSTIGYFNGTAYLAGFGLPGPEFDNLEPEYRCYRGTHGCLFDGIVDIFVDTPHNFAVKTLTKCFGPMPGSYSGYYPTRLEAYQIIRNSKVTIPHKEFLSGHFSINNRFISIKLKTSARALITQ